MIEEMTPQEFVRLRDSGECWQLLDVREAAEIETACVPSAVTIPMGDITTRRVELDSNIPVAVLCHSGVRSARVASYLISNGFERVANISGGIDAWSLDVDPEIPRY
jgi:rhodanese-related sulfurtransferase